MIYGLENLNTHYTIDKLHFYLFVIVVDGFSSISDLISPVLFFQH